MKTSPTFLVLTALALSGLCASAQAIDLNIGAAGYNCGVMSTPVYCYGIPTVVEDVNGAVTANGSIWVDAQKVWSNTLGSYKTGGFIIINGQEYAITGPAAWVPMVTGGGTETYTFTGGSISLVYTAYYSAGGGGRGGGGAGYRWIVAPTSTLTLQ